MVRRRPTVAQLRSRDRADISLLVICAAVGAALVLAAACAGALL